MGWTEFGRAGVATLSVATDESCIGKLASQQVDKTEWHRVVAFQDGHIDVFQRHAMKGCLLPRRFAGPAPARLPRLGAPDSADARDQAVVVLRRSGRRARLAARRRA